MSNSNPSVSPFEIVTAKNNKKISKSTIIISISIVAFLILGVAAGVLLVKQQQNISEKAAANLCPGVQACPVSGRADLLRNCNPANADLTPQEFSCSNVGNVGQVAACGTRSFCCPSLGASWTTDLTLCSVQSPTPTAAAAATATSAAAFATAAPTASSSATPTATASSSASPRPQAMPREIPVTGTDWPSVLVGVIGAAAIIGAILLAI